MSEHEHSESGHGNSTDASNDWLGNKLARWTGHTILTTVGEVNTICGMVYTPISVGLTLSTGNPLFLLGTLPTLAGAVIGWQGAKRTGSIEKSAFVGIKAFAAGALHFFGAPIAAIAAGLSIASTALAMRDRA